MLVWKWEKNQQDYYFAMSCIGRDKCELNDKEKNWTTYLQHVKPSLILFISNLILKVLILLPLILLLKKRETERDRDRERDRKSDRESEERERERERVCVCVSHGQVFKHRHRN